MKKRLKKEIYCKNFSSGYGVRYSDLPESIEPNDIIRINDVESHYSENNSWDAFTELIIIREVEETEDEYQKRLSKEKILEEEFKKRRYDTYIKLKSEFEPIKK